MVVRVRQKLVAPQYHNAKADRRFAKADARGKLKRLYPEL